MNSYSENAKSEILKTAPDKECCQLAFLSAVIHTAGSIFISQEGLRVEISCDDYKFISRLIEIFVSFYGIKPQTDGKKIYLYAETAQTILFDCCILGVVDGEATIVSGIADTVVEEDHCKASYIRGAFLGAGSVSLKSGYHLEFALSSKDMANDVANILSESGIKSKVITHNEKYVLYVNDMESVCDCLTLMGAINTVLTLRSESVVRDIRKQTNRINNCEFANMDRTADASIRQRRDIKLIESKVGISSLQPKLAQTAQMRLDYPDDSFTSLAERLKIPKSTLKNRLKKLTDIAKKLQEKGE